MYNNRTLTSPRNTNLVIGQWPGFTTTNATYSLTELRFHSGCLSPEQVQYNFGVGAARWVPTPSVTASPTARAVARRLAR